MSNSYITNAAAIAGEGINRGLTKEEVVDLLDEGAENKRAALRGRIDEKRAERAERAQSQKTADDYLGETARGFQSKGKFVEQERYPDPFGVPVSPADPERYTKEEQREINAQDFLNERGNWVIVDRGKGKERLWRENGQLVSDPKFVKNKRPDMADPFFTVNNAIPGAGMGGSNGLATQLSDMVGRGEISRDQLVPGSTTKTIGMLIDDMAINADPQLRREADINVGRELVRQDVSGLPSEEVKRRAEAQLAREFAPQGLSNYIASEDQIKVDGKPWPKQKSSQYAPFATSSSVNQRQAREAALISALGASRDTTAAQAVSYELAEREAGRFQMDYDAVANLDRIENIKRLGLASKKFNRGVDMAEFEVVPGVDPRTFDDAIQMIGPDGSTVGYADNQDRFIADVNLPGTDNLSNAPLSRTATWMEANLPDAGVAGGINFGVREVNAGDELRMLNQRLGNFGLATGIRGIDDLEQVVRAITVDAAFSGRQMYNYDAEKGKAIGVSNPGLDEVLYGLDYTADEKTRLAQSLQNVEAAMSSPVNRTQKDLFAAGIPSESQSRRRRNLVGVQGSVYNGETGVESDYDYYETLYNDEPRVAPGFEKNVQLARITDERVGRDNKKRGEKRINVRAGLKGLNASPEEVFKGRDPNTIYATTPEGERVMLPEAQQDLIDARVGLADAQKPFQGAPQGEKPERARFAGKGVYKMSPDERVQRFGPAGAEAAGEVIRRAIENKQLRSAEAKAEDPRASLMRQKDAEFAAAGEARGLADNAREVNEAFERMGLPLEGKGQMLLGGQIVPDSRPASADVPDRNIVPQGPLQVGETLDSRSLANFARRQQATSAVTNPSPDPIPLAVRSGWMGGDNRGSVVNPWTGTSAPQKRSLEPDPWDSAPATGKGISQEVAKRSMKSTPSLPYGLQSSGPAQGPVPGSARKQFTDRAQNFGKSPKYDRINRYGRRSAIAGGAVAGLAGIDGLINGERNKREEAQY